ncbi:MAG: hypothetical protein E6J88_13995 [Deltaproteobacteria bacterium]|nr:MAG: hypothetical protein E6J88_13995 [Deltaproteobacteria bacterium]
MDATRSQRVDHRRQAARSARDQDPAVRGILGEGELADAKCKQRRKRRFQIELAFVDLGQMHEQVGLDVACVPRQGMGGVEQFPIRQRLRSIHGVVVTRRFSEGRRRAVTRFRGRDRA